MSTALPPPPDLASAERLVRLRHETRDRIDKMIVMIEDGIRTGGDSQRSLTSLASLVRHLRLAQDDAVKAEWVAESYRRANPEDMDEDVYVDELRAAADGMAEDHLRVFVDSWMERHQMIAVVEQVEARPRFDPVRPRPAPEPPPPPAPPPEVAPSRRSHTRAALIAATGKERKP